MTCEEARWNQHNKCIHYKRRLSWWEKIKNLIVRSKAVRVQCTTGDKDGTVQSGR